MTITPAPQPATTDTPVGGIGGAVKRAAGGPAPRDTYTEAWALVHRAQAGDVDAFADLYRLYRSPVRRFIYRRTTSNDLADDLTSATFVNALRSIGTLQSQGGSPEAWFTTIARNLVFDHYKSARVRLAARADHADAENALATIVDTDPGPETAAITAATRAAVRAAVTQLPDKQRHIIELRYLADLSIAETCARTGWNEGVVKSLTYRAVRRLAQTLTGEAIAA